MIVTLRCLLVDDSLDFLQTARALLEQEGLQIVGIATTGADALVRAAELRPGVQT
jgi:two-component system, NarL family, nitrate/nitrite response regulator NarL